MFILIGYSFFKYITLMNVLIKNEICIEKSATYKINQHSLQYLTGLILLIKINCKCNKM